MNHCKQDSGDIAWPGFVDILSAVIIMFVFFVMITAIVMFVLSVNHKQMMEMESKRQVEREIEIIQEQVLQRNQMSADEFEEEIQRIRDYQELSNQNQKMVQEIDQLKADLAKAKKQSAVEDPSGGVLTVLFQKNEMTLTDMTQEMIANFVGEIKERGVSDIVIVLEAGDSPSNLFTSSSRELSLARSLNIRNMLLKEGIDPSKIKLTYKKPEEVEGTHHWVRIKVEEP